MTKKKRIIVLVSVFSFIALTILIRREAFFRPNRVLFIYGLEENSALHVVRYYNAATKKDRYYLKRLNENGGKIWSRRLDLEPPASFLNGDPPRMALIGGGIFLNGKIQERNPDLYFSGDTNITMAYDLETGRKLWESEPFVWQQDIGSYMIPFDDCFINMYWDSEKGRCGLSYDTETGKALAVFNNLHPGFEFQFGGDYLACRDAEGWALLDPRSGAIVHRFNASWPFLNRGKSYYYLSDDEDRLMELDTDSMNIETLLDISIIGSGYHFFDQDFSLGHYQDKLYSYVKIRGLGEADISTLEQDGIIFHTFPEWAFRQASGHEYFYSRDNQFYHLFRGSLTAFIPVFVESWDRDAPDGSFLGFIDTARGEVVTVSRRGPDDYLRVSPIIRYGEQYYCIWDRGHEDSWLMIFDGPEGALVRCYALDMDYSELSSYSFSGDFLWVHRNFGYGYAVFDTRTGDLVHTTEKDGSVSDVTDEALEYFYEE